MTGQERIRRAFAFEESDRVAIDLAGHLSSGIAAIAYVKLRKELGLCERVVRVHDVLHQLAVVDEDVLDLLGVDTIELGRGFAVDDESWVDWELPDGTACQIPSWAMPERVSNEEGEGWVYRSKGGRVMGWMPDGALYFNRGYGRVLEEGGRGIDNIAGGMEGCMWTAVRAAPGDISYEELGAGAKRLRVRTERAIVGVFGGNLMEMGQKLYRNDEFLMLLAGEPGEAHAFLDGVVEIHVERLEKYLGAVGEYIDVILFGDDLGMQIGPQISVEMFREFFKPRYEVMWKRAKELSGAKVNMHSCGEVSKLLPDLIDAGLEAINPIQITCPGMELAELKKEFGGDIVFWGGGCDTQDVLPKGTVDEVRRHVREQAGVFGVSGGYVFQQVHNVLSNVPAKNIVAMYEGLGIRG